PMVCGQALLLFCPLQPPMNASLGMAWYDHSTLPESISTATIASPKGCAGSVCGSPVPKYTAWRTGSTLGELHTDPPAGAYTCTPFEFFCVGLGSAITYVFQSCSPVEALSAATLPRDVQHS